YRRARALIDEATATERAAKKLSAGWEAEIGLAIEVAFPTALMLECLQGFGAESPHTRIELIESVLGGTTEALLTGQADIAVTGILPAGFAGEFLMPIRFVPAAHPEHALHKLGRPVTKQDMRMHRQLVVRESSAKRATKLRLEADQRWTVTHMATSIEASGKGYGYGWYPEYRIAEAVAAGRLKALPMREGGESFAQLYLVYADRETAGPGVLRLAAIIRELADAACIKERGKQ
ncbi:MAG: LysR substrate-binding domain-containing protein, partial [Burkholderiales bacterium]